MTISKPVKKEWQENKNEMFNLVGYVFKKMGGNPNKLRPKIEEWSLLVSHDDYDNRVMILRMYLDNKDKGAIKNALREFISSKQDYA